MTYIIWVITKGLTLIKIAPLSCFYHQLLPATKLIRMKPSLCEKIEVVKIDG